MKEVSKDEFYSAIGPLDVVLTLTHIEDGRYRTDFRLRYGGLKGVTVDQLGYPAIHKYYLMEGTE